MKIIMLGAPGAGKGTQADMICNKYNVPHISTGDIFRANIKNGTELGRKAKDYMDKGLLVPDSLVVDLVIDRIHEDDAKDGYVLDDDTAAALVEEAFTLEDPHCPHGRPIYTVISREKLFELVKRT